MQIFRDFSEYKTNENTIVTIGSFDGLHLGHQFLLDKIVDEAKFNNLKSVVFTFFPSANQFFSLKKVKQINTISEKINLIEQQNIDFLIFQAFNAYIANLEAEIFVKDILVNQLKIKKLIIGYDHRLGKNRTAGFEELLAFGNKYQFEVANIEAFKFHNNIVSSTKIRELIEMGALELANLFLGYNFSMQGKVIHGKKIGTLLGFPTANIVLEDELKILPKIGVYFVEIIVREINYFGMLNIGNNPTFNQNKLSIEVHLFNFNDNIYDKEIKINFIKKIRDEKKFDNKYLLINQLEEDKNLCFKWINEINTK